MTLKIGSGSKINRIMAPKDAHVRIPGTREYVTWQMKMEVVAGIKVDNWLALK